MEVLTRSTSADIDLPPIRISTEDLLEIAKGLPGEGLVEVTVGDYSDARQIRLQGYDDIEKNQSILSIPLVLKRDMLEVSIRKFYVGVKAPADKGYLVDATKNLLVQYKPWFHFIGSGWFFALVIMGPMMMLSMVSDLEGFDLFISQMVLAAFLGLPLDFVKRRLLVSRVQFNPRSTFLQRNMDNIIMLIIGTVIGAIVANLTRVFGG